MEQYANGELSRIIVAGNGGGLRRYVQVQLTVIPPPDFAIGAAPSSLSIAEGNQGTSTITTFALFLFNNSINLTGVGRSVWNNRQLEPKHNSRPRIRQLEMGITVGKSMPTGTYPITVTGNGEGIQQ